MKPKMIGLFDIKVLLIYVKFLQEAIVVPPHVAFAVRQNPGFWEFVKVSADDLSVEGITTTDFLKFKEMVYDEKWYVQYILHLALIAYFMPPKFPVSKALIYLTTA